MEILNLKEVTKISKSKFNTLESIAIVLSTLAPFTVISLSRTLINETKSSILLNLIYITFICLIFVLLICYLFKKFSGLDIFDVSKFLGGNIFKNIVGFLFIVYFITTSSMLLRDFCECFRVIYYSYTDIIYIIAIFAIIINFVSTFGFNSTVKTTAIIFPIIMVSVFLLFIGNIRNFSFERISPILGNGIKNTFVTCLSNIGAFSGLIYLYILPPLLKEPQKYKKICVWSTILSGTFIILCVATLLFMFSVYVSTDEVMPLFFASRYIEFGNFFQRFESLFLLIWTISFCCYLSICFKFSTYTFAKIFNLSDFTQLVNIFSTLLFSLTLLPKEYATTTFFESKIYRGISISIMVLGFFILVLGNWKLKYNNSKKEKGVRF